ncbi:MAG TPA: hypothetical protein VNG53_09015 [Bacteroidia bacterium]|nr:hypothetical protein [Bacteroidia bacterium]
MKSEKLQELIRWLNDQINHANGVIEESQRNHNYGRESQYEGIRDAFMRCLNKVGNEVQ